jgi:hypothetical protein
MEFFFLSLFNPHLPYRLRRILIFLRTERRKSAKIGDVDEWTLFEWRTLGTMSIQQGAIPICAMKDALGEAGMGLSMKYIPIYEKLLKCTSSMTSLCKRSALSFGCLTVVGVREKGASHSFPHTRSSRTGSPSDKKGLRRNSTP